MQKLIGIIIIVIGIWVGIEVYTQGVDGAFGGIFASLGGGGDAPSQASQPDAAPSAPKAHSSVVQRAGDRVQGHIDQGEERINEQVEDQ